MIVGLFTGQGSQYSGMGRDLYENFQSVREIYQCGEDILGFDLKKVSFYGDNRELARTENAQPAIFAHSLAAYTVFCEIAKKPDCLGGHSLGEITALAGGKAYTLEKGFRIIKARSQAMAKLEKEATGAMSAILRLPRRVVEELCQKVAGIVQPANYNLETQTVISGEIDAVEKVENLAKEAGGRGVRLAVSNAFHTPLMEKAAWELREKINWIDYKKVELPFFSNITGELTNFHEEIPDYPEYFYKQMISSVEFTKEMNAMKNFGGEKYVEFGPKKVLSGLLKKHLPLASTNTIDTLEDVRKAEKEKG